MNSTSNWPDLQEECEFLNQLHAQHPLAKEAITNRYLPLLIHFLIHAYPSIEPEVCATAAADAVFNFIRNLKGYDPNRLSLSAYLRMAARADLRNELEKERRARRGIPLDSVAEPDDRRNIRREEGPTWDDPRLLAENAAFNHDEQVTLELMRTGVRGTAVFAARLNLSHLPNAEQTAAVKRLKDRVKKRLARAVEDSQ